MHMHGAVVPILLHCQCIPQVDKPHTKVGVCTHPEAVGGGLLDEGVQVRQGVRHMGALLP